jgi:hypothetical protein
MSYLIAATHELAQTALCSEKLSWQRAVAGVRCRIPHGGLFVDKTGEVWARYSITGIRSQVGIVVNSSEECAWAWARGVPALTCDDDDVLEIGISLAEAVAPTLRPAPRTQVLGFRGYCAARRRGLSIDGRLFDVAPWRWSPDITARCECYEQRCPVVPGDRCGFYGAARPHDVRLYLNKDLPTLLVCAPLGRVVVHEEGWRAERYDVLAIVVPLDMPIPVEDPRIVRARNLPLRAWEIAQELEAFGQLSHVTEEEVKLP